MDPKIETTWKEALKPEFEQPYFHLLVDQLREAKKTQTIYPPGRFIFEAFNRTPLPAVKVVILGQDPYHGPNQAHGLCFSVQKGVRTPPSLVNIYKELHTDLGIQAPNHGELTAWADQGVFLLNAILTVQASKPSSHSKWGWEQFTDSVIRLISEKRENVVFILWGKFAKEKASLIDASKHLVLTSSHPSPYSANYGFLGSKPFSKTNAYLQEHGIEPVNWSIPD